MSADYRHLVPAETRDNGNGVVERAGEEHQSSPRSWMTRSRRLVLGFAILIFVDIVLVATSEFTEYLTDGDVFLDTPYFATYVKTSLLVVYLFGFVLYRSWWYQCKTRQNAVLNRDAKKLDGEHSEELTEVSVDKQIGDPIFVPVKFDTRSGSVGGSESDDYSVGGVKRSRSVRFNHLSEVRQLSAEHADDALFARMSYAASIRKEEARRRASNRLSVKQTMQISVFFSLLLFFSSLAFAESLKALGSVLSVSLVYTSLVVFTLMLTTLLPSSAADRINLSKLLIVALCVGGLTAMSWSATTKAFQPFNFSPATRTIVIPSHSDTDTLDNTTPSLVPGEASPMISHSSAVYAWPVVSALLLSLFVVLLKRCIESEEKLNLAMFYGFIGLFIFLFLWPGLGILHLTGIETFRWPDNKSWLLVAINGTAITFVSNVLWLWGCFLTSSLTAALSLSLVLPMSIVAHSIIHRVNCAGSFYVTLVPVVISYVSAILLLYRYEDQTDPLIGCLRSATQSICLWRRARGRTGRGVRRSALRDDDSNEQRESLIGDTTGASINADPLDNN